MIRRRASEPVAVARSPGAVRDDVSLLYIRERLSPRCYQGTRNLTPPPLVSNELKRSAEASGPMMIQSTN